MADNDYNIIKPVGGLQNIAGITAAKHREQKKRRQNSHGEKEKNAEQQTSDLTDQDKINGESNQVENGHHPIDYCA